jgi:hypothetical protein
MLITAMLMSSCEILDVPDEPAVSPANPATADATPNQDTTAGLDTEWESIQWHGNSAAGATKVMSLSASMTSRDVRFSYDHYPWGGSMGLVHFFFWNGTTWQGGKFDWIRAGGQSLKLLENIHDGYNGLHAPPSGSPVAFAWTSADGRERSNLAKTVWP